jgi:hypothetical protein
MFQKRTFHESVFHRFPCCDVLSSKDVPWERKKEFTDRSVRFYLEKNELTRSPAPLDVTMRRAAWEQEVERGITSQIAEIGIRQMIHPLAAIGAGVGFGLDNESPDVRATLGFQRSF